jgi:transposase
MANTMRSREREAFWRDVPARFRTSGLSVRAFCRREKLHESAFYFWRRTVSERDAGSTPPTKRPPVPQPRRPAFLPVTIRSASGGSGLTLELPNGAVLRFNDAMPVERIAALVRALEVRA